MEAKSDCWIQLEFGADSVAHCVFAPGDADFGTEDDGRGNVRLHVPPLSFLQTCDNQRKDSPVGAFILSPEPLGGDEEDREETTKQGEKGRKKERTEQRKD